MVHGSMKWGRRWWWCRSDARTGNEGDPVFYGKMIYLIPDSHQLLLWQALVLVSQQSLQG